MRDKRLLINEQRSFSQIAETVDLTRFTNKDGGLEFADGMGQWLWKTVNPLVLPVILFKSERTQKELYAYPVDSRDAWPMLAGWPDRVSPRH